MPSTGFRCRRRPSPTWSRYMHDLDLVERSHLPVPGRGQRLQAGAARVLPTAWCARWPPGCASIHESALGEVELWSKSAAAQLDAQLRERRRNFGRRIEAIDRIQSGRRSRRAHWLKLTAQEANACERAAMASCLELTDLPDAGAKHAPCQGDAPRPNLRPDMTDVVWSRICRPQVVALAGAAMGATSCRGKTRAILTASGCPRSCCSRRRWPPCWITSRASWNDFRMLQRWPAASLDEVLALVERSGLLQPRAQPAPLRAGGGAASWRPVSRDGGAACSHLPGIGTLHGRGHCCILFW